VRWRRVYDLFSRYYQDIFPPGAAQLAFLREVARQVGACTFLDAGCATGAYTRAAASWGLAATGIDLEPAMIEEARSQGPPQVHYAVADLTALPFEDGSFDMVVCLGNTLAHVLEFASLQRALDGFGRVLSPRGALVLQLVNYHRVKADPEYVFPVLASTDGNVIFRRRYRRRGDGLYSFATSLQVGRQQVDGASPLRPWRQEEIIAALAPAGFSRWHSFGDFGRSSYSASASALGGTGRPPRTIAAGASRSPGQGSCLAGSGGARRDRRVTPAACRSGIAVG